MQSRTRNTCLLLSFLLGTATPAVAEVMDKDPTTDMIWRSGIVLAVLALGAGRLHPLLGVLLVLLVPNVPLGVLFEIHDPSVGPHIRAEAGMGYVFQTYAANGLVLSSYLIGGALWHRRRKSRRRAAS